MHVWIDLTNSPHVLVMRPVIEELQRRGHDVDLTHAGGAADAVRAAAKPIADKRGTVEYRVAMAGVLAAPVWSAAALAVQALQLVLQWLAALPLATVSVAQAPLWAGGAGVLGGVLARRRKAADTDPAVVTGRQCPAVGQIGRAHV